MQRELLDGLCRLVPDRTVLSVQDGHYATKKFLRGLPSNARIVSRLPIASPLYGRPEPKQPGTPGVQAKIGPRLGSPKQLAEAAAALWQAHPEEDGAEVLVVEGYWHTVMPGVWLRVVIVRRPEEKATKQKKALEAFFTSLLLLDMKQILAEYRARWSVEILIREAREHYGLGQDRCRRYERIVGVNGFRMVIGAAQVLWFAREVGQQPVALTPYQPWYLQKQKPSLHDIMWAVRERLLKEGITPRVGIWQGMGVIHRLRSEQRPGQVARAA